MDTAENERQRSLPSLSKELKIMNNWSIRKWSILTAILCMVLVALTIVSTLFSVKDLLYESLCAILGVVLTAIVTVLLLRGQTDIEADQSKSAKVFEEKLQIYKEFLNALCDVIKDGIITKEEYVQLQFQFATITMHTELKNTKKISDSVFNIINDLQASKDGLSDRLMAELLNIVEVLRGELYVGTTTMSDKEKESLVFNFTEIRGSFEDASNEQEEENHEPMLGNDSNEADMKTAIKAFVEAVKENLRSWAESKNVNMYVEKDKSLRITSSVIGTDTAKDCFRWQLSDEISLYILQNSITDKVRRRDIYQKVKQMGYLATYSTNWGATVYPAWDKRFLYPKTVANNEFHGVLKQIVAQDANLVQAYSEWIKEIYQKFEKCKIGNNA